MKRTHLLFMIITVVAYTLLGIFVDIPANHSDMALVNFIVSAFSLFIGYIFGHINNLEPSNSHSSKERPTKHERRKK